jgi:hypothetical protein
METAHQAWLKQAALPLLRGLRRDEMMRFFVRNAGGGKRWGVWLFSFPSLAAAAATPREAACVSWLVAEVMPDSIPSFLRRIVVESEQRMRRRLRLTTERNWL